MYCIKCGVELAEGEKVCPLCGLKPYHPELSENSGEKSYPISKVPSYETVNKQGVLFLITMLFLVPMVITILCDTTITGGFSWSGYVVGGLLLAYISIVLPAWFKKPNPVIFVPIFFAAVVVFLLYIDIATGDEWFLSFAFPTVGTLGLIVTALIAVVKYVKKGYWYIASAGVFATGIYVCLIEFFLHITFGIKTHFPWSLYPLVGCLIIGGTLLVIAISKPLRRRVQKKFFI